MTPDRLRPDRPPERRRSPSDAWQDMVEGNLRFVDGTPAHPRQDVERRAELLAKQSPGAALFGCSDSRLAAEIIFDQGIGDLFVVRNAGQVISDSVIGSLEYAVAVLEVPLIVVLGHDACGAVAAAILTQDPHPPALPPHIENLIAGIIPAVKRVKESIAVTSEGERAERDDVVDPHDVGREHLRDTIADLLEMSDIIRTRVTEGSLAVVGANYRLGEGQVVPDVLLGLGHGTSRRPS